MAYEDLSPHIDKKTKGHGAMEKAKQAVEKEKVERQKLRQEKAAEVQYESISVEQLPNNTSIYYNTFFVACLRAPLANTNHNNSIRV